MHCLIPILGSFSLSMHFEKNLVLNFCVGSVLTCMRGQLWTMPNPFISPPSPLSSFRKPLHRCLSRNSCLFRSPSLYFFLSLSLVSLSFSAFLCLYGSVALSVCLCLSLSLSHCLSVSFSLHLSQFLFPTTYHFLLQITPTENSLTIYQESVTMCSWFKVCSSILFSDNSHYLLTIGEN